MASKVGDGQKKQGPAPWSRFATAALIAPVLAWFLGFLPVALYVAAIAAIWLGLLRWVLLGFARSRERTISSDWAHSIGVGMGLGLAMAVTCWVPISLTFALRHDLQIPKTSGLAPNNSFKPTPLRGAA